MVLVLQNKPEKHLSACREAPRSLPGRTLSLSLPEQGQPGSMHSRSGHCSCGQIWGAASLTPLIRTLILKILILFLLEKPRFFHYYGIGFFLGEQQFSSFVLKAAAIFVSRNAGHHTQKADFSKIVLPTHANPLQKGLKNMCKTVVLLQESPLQDI